MPDLSVDVSRNDIVVSKPSSGLSVTYRRTGRVLVALDSMRNDPKGEELNFLVRGWNAAFAKAQSLGLRRDARSSRSTRKAMRTEENRAGEQVSRA
jgi:hypothetical protein